MKCAKNFEHFILTAFNVDCGLKNREQILSNEYLSQRFQLFKQFCFPSIFRQTNQNFKWLVFFDSETPDSFKNEISHFADWTNFIPVYLTPVTNSRYFWRETVKKYISPGSEFVITSNLDNDDSLSKDFVEIVQAQFQEQNFLFLNFPYGYMLRENGLFLREFLSSPFISLIEKVDDLLTCRIIEHHDLFTLYQQGVPVLQIFTKPAWLQVVHTTNVVNRMDINSVIQPISKLKERFVIQVEEAKYHKSPGINLFFDWLVFNKHKLPFSLRIRRLASIFMPSVASLYLKYSLQAKEKNLSRPQLSIAAARSLCENSR